MNKTIAIVVTLMITTSVFAKQARTRNKAAIALYEHGATCSEISEYVLLKRIKTSGKVGSVVAATTIVAALVLGPLTMAAVIPGTILLANAGLEFGAMTLLTGRGMLRTGKKTPYTGFLNKRLGFQVEVMKYEANLYDAEKFMDLTGWDFQYEDEKEYVRKKIASYHNRKHHINTMIENAPSTVFSKNESVNVVVAKLNQMDRAQELCSFDGKKVFFDSKKELQAKVNEILK